MNQNSESFKRYGIANVGVEKIKTMIEGFDDISHGGMPVGRTTLVSGTSGTCLLYTSPSPRDRQ